jgi:hypothetical protein
MRVCTRRDVRATVGRTMELVGGGVLGLIALALVIWAGLNIALSESSMLAKVLWILAILVIPIVGFIAWLLFGPRKAA